MPVGEGDFQPVSEVHHESDSQSNNNTLRGSFGGDLLSRSFVGPAGANLTPTLNDQITHRNSMGALGTQQIQPIDAAQQYEEQKDE